MPFVKQPSRRRRKLKKLLVILALSLVGVAVAGAVGYHFYAGWRARDLAVKARENFAAGNYRAAWLQLSSARSLRENDPEVIRSGALIETGFGRKGSMTLWDELARKITLSEEDRLERSVATLRHGTDEQFDTAIREYEGVGDLAKAGALRTARRVIRGDLDGAIVEARKAIEATSDPFLRLDVAKLLRQRHASDFASPQQNTAPVKQEIATIVDSLLDTEAAEQALAFGLGNLATLPQETRQRWTTRAMQRQAPDNPALLPAADAMVRGQDTTAAKIYGQLRPLYDSAPLDRRASFALWLSSQGLAREALGLVTALEAAAASTACWAGGRSRKVMPKRSKTAAASAWRLRRMSSRAWLMRGSISAGFSATAAAASSWVTIEPWNSSW